MDHEKMAQDCFDKAMDGGPGSGPQSNGESSYQQSEGWKKRAQDIRNMLTNNKLIPGERKILLEKLSVAERNQ